MSTQKLPNKSLAWPIPWAAVALIAESESLRLKAYRCPAGVWTIGWGETDSIEPGDRWTKEHADARLCYELKRYSIDVLRLCKRSPSANELGALTSLAYNIGLAGLAKSSVLKAHNRGDSQAAARAFALWNKARVNGQLTVLRGLTIRRSREAALYLTPDDATHAEPVALPQAVASESNLAASPIAQSGAATAGAGALTLLSSASENASTVQGAVSTVAGTAGQAQGLVATVSNALGVQPGVLLAVVLIGAGLAALYWRMKQREEGYA